MLTIAQAGSLTYSTRSLVESTCTHCNCTIYVYEDEKNDESKNVCHNHGGSWHNQSWNGWIPTYVKKCECGAKAARDPWHSRWCPVYEDPMKPKE